MSMAPSAKPRNIRAGLALLKNPEFCQDSLRVIRESVGLAETDLGPEQRERVVAELLGPFMQRWGVPPPHAGELVNPDPRRRLDEALMSGRWGVVTVFGWTSNQAVARAVQRIRRVVRKRHDDAESLQRAQLARWLEDCGFSPAQIAKVVWGRRDGLHRPGRSAAIRRLPRSKEERLMKTYMGEGLSYEEAERRTYRQARGSEPKAVSAVRVAKSRYVEYMDSLNEALLTPTPSEPISHAVTMLLRARRNKKDEVEVANRVAALQTALYALASP